MEKNIEWLKDYCETLRNIIKDKSATSDEKCEAAGKLKATLDQIAFLERDNLWNQKKR